MDGGTWQATVHGVAKSQTRLSDFIFFLSIRFFNFLSFFPVLSSPSISSYLPLRFIPFLTSRKSIAQLRTQILEPKLVGVKLLGSESWL